MGGASNTGKSVAAVTALPTGTGHTRGRRPTRATGPADRAGGIALAAVGTARTVRLAFAAAVLAPPFVEVRPPAGMVFV